MELLKNKLTQNKSTLSVCFISTFVFGLAAHAYMFFNNNFSHDSLNEFNSNIFGDNWKIQLGRYIVPLYRQIFRSDLTIPWLIGLYALIWIALAVFFVVKIFNNESRLFIILVSGILSTNITVTATTATYIHDLDCNMFAMMCSVIAIFLWNKYKFGFIPGSFLIMLSLGIYQSFLCVSITLVLFICIINLMSEQKFNTVMIKGIKSLAMFFIGGVLYLCSIKIALNFAQVDIATDKSNSIYNITQIDISNIKNLIFWTYTDCIAYILNTISSYSQSLTKTIIIILTVIIGIVILATIINKNIRWKEKLLIIFLCTLIPFGMYCVFLISNGMMHDIMTYSTSLFFIFALVLSYWIVKNKIKFSTVKKLTKALCIILILFIISGNVQVANAVYLKKEIEHEATLSTFTRIMYKIEDNNDYTSNETPVVFIGLPIQIKDCVTGFEKYQRIAGVGTNNSLARNAQSVYKAYFDYIMMTSILLADEETWNKLQNDPRVSSMPSYPDDGCINFIDNVMVVKLSD